VSKSHRPLSGSEIGILKEVQDFWGSQNGEPDVLINDSDEAVIFVIAKDGSSPVMINLTNLGAWLHDGTLAMTTVREWVQGPLAAASQGRVVTVFMPLLDEGVEVWRPVEAEALPSGWYRIKSINEQPDNETWAFDTNGVVVCQHRQLSGGEALVVVGQRQ
jgi:hypothetical protein